MSIRITFAALINQKVQKETKKSERLENFRLSRPMPLNFEAYIDHFLYQFDLNEECLAVVYIILQNFIEEIDTFNIQKLTYTALAVTYKAFVDRPAKNSDLEKIGVLKKGELFKLESTLLSLINWDLKYSLIDSTLQLLQTHQQDISDSEQEDIEDQDMMEYETCESASELTEIFLV